MRCIRRCVKMDFDVEEGQSPEDCVDFAVDALDFESQLKETKDVKFTEQLSKPLEIGSLITCIGTPSDDIPWFALNIGCGEAEKAQGDILLHVNVRIPQRYVVRNARRSMRWGSEETTSFRSFPFEVGQKFVMEILVDEKEYLIAVDGVQYCAFSHRNAVTEAGWLQATGLRDATISVGTTTHYPTTQTPLLEVPLIISENEIQDLSDWQPHFIAALSNGIPESHQLVIQGRLRAYLHSFTVDLLEAGQEWPRTGVALHVSVRARGEKAPARPAPHLVVLNTWQGAWGVERRSRSAHLIPNTHVSIKIMRSACEWSVYADSTLLGTLEHRLPPGAVRALRLRGDLYPTKVYLCPVEPEPQVPLAT